MPPRDVMFRCAISLFRCGFPDMKDELPACFCLLQYLQNITLFSISSHGNILSQFAMKLYVLPPPATVDVKVTAVVTIASLTLDASGLSSKLCEEIRDTFRSHFDCISGAAPKCRESRSTLQHSAEFSLTAKYSSLAVLAVARGNKDGFSSCPMHFRSWKKGQRCFSWNPFPLDHWTDPLIKVGDTPSSRLLTVCSNHSSVSLPARPRCAACWGDACKQGLPALVPALWCGGAGLSAGFGRMLSCHAGI
nr:uncharacterized protein LOC112076054 [Salvelinus alpinus]